MWDWVQKIIDWFNKRKKPEPAESDTFTNACVNYGIRLKDYHNSPNREHKGRRTSVKLDTRFHTEHGMTNANTKVTVGGIGLAYYGIDAENGKHDLCFADGVRFPEDYGMPCYLKIYINDLLHTVVMIPKWVYGTVYVTEKVTYR